MLIQVAIGLAMLVFVVAFLVLMGRGGRRRERELKALVEELGFAWSPAGELLSPSEWQERRDEVGEPESAQGTHEGWRAGLFPYHSSEWPIRLRLASPFPGEIASSAPRSRAENAVHFDTDDAAVDAFLKTRHLDASREAQAVIEPLLDFLGPWLPRLARFVVSGDELRIHFQRGGAQPKHRYLEAEDAREVLPDLIILAGRLGASAG